MRYWLLMLAAAVGLHDGAMAQATDDIIVSGQRGKRDPEKAFVEAMAAPSANGQLARFTEKICPRGFGLSEQNNQGLAQRIRRVAAAAKIPVAEEGCRPNIIILFVTDRRQAIARWRTDRPDFFTGLTPSRISALAAGTDPVTSWQIVRVMGKDGRPIGKADSDMYDYLVNEQTVPSRLVSSIQIEFAATFVLIEQKLIGDASLVQLADYAAMRTLANTDAMAAAGQRLPTILSLFSSPGEPVPLSLTEWDLRYLTALYDSPLAARASQQQRSMGKLIKQDADRGDSETGRR